MTPPQTFSYLADNVPHRGGLLEAFKGKPLQSLRTPAAVIDRALFAQNCALMYDAVKIWNADFRAHVKTHKVGSLSSFYLKRGSLKEHVETREGVILQLQISDAKKTSAVVVSTIMEGQEIIRSGLVYEGIVKDVCLLSPCQMR